MTKREVIRRVKKHLEGNLRAVEVVEKHHGDASAAHEEAALNAAILKYLTEAR